MGRRHQRAVFQSGSDVRNGQEPLQNEIVDPPPVGHIAAGCRHVLVVQPETFHHILLAGDDAEVVQPVAGLAKNNGPDSR